MTEHVSSTTVLNQSKLGKKNDVGVLTHCCNLNQHLSNEYALENLPNMPKSSEQFDRDPVLVLSGATTVIDEIDPSQVSCSQLQGSPDSTQFLSIASDQNADDKNYTIGKQKEYDDVSSINLHVKSSDMSLICPSSRCQEQQPSFEVNGRHEKDDNRVNTSQSIEYTESRSLDQTGLESESTGLERTDPTPQTTNDVMGQRDKTSHGMDGKESAGSVSKMEKFDYTGVLSLRHSLISLVQEKSLLKQRADEYELKIHDLVANISGLEKERETLQQRLKQQQADFDSQMADTKRALDSKLGKIEMEERFGNIIKFRKEEQSDLLRQETTKLQLSHYRQEQKIRELEAKLKSQEKVSSKSLTQWMDFQKKLANLTNLYDTASSSVARLEQSVEATRDLSRNLDKIHCQYKQQLKAKDVEIQELKQSLSVAEVKMKQNSLQAASMMDVKSRLAIAQDKVKQLESSNSSLQAELQKQMHAAQQALGNMDGNQELIQKYLASTTKYREEVANYRKKYKSAIDQCNSMSDKVDAAERQLGEKEKDVKAREVKWQKELNKLRDSLQSKMNQMEALQEAKDTLEESNHQLSLSNQKLSHSMEEAEAILNVPKAEASIQAGQSLYLMLSHGVQACPDTRAIACNIQPLTYTNYTQTTSAQSIRSTPAQTDVSSLNSRTVAVQTFRKIFMTKASGPNDKRLYTKNMGSQTILASINTYLKFGRQTDGSDCRQPKHDASKNTKTGVLSKDPVPVRTFPGRFEGTECVTSEVEVSKAMFTSKQDDQGARDGAKSGQDTVDQNEALKSDLRTDFGTTGWNDDMVKTMSTGLKAKFKGILKAPNHTKGRETPSKSVNFQDKLETCFLVSPNPIDNTHTTAHPRRPRSQSSRARKPSLRLSTLPLSTCPQNLDEKEIYNNIKKELHDVDSTSDVQDDGVPCQEAPLPPEERDVLSSAVKDVFSSLDNSMNEVNYVYKKEILSNSKEGSSGTENHTNQETEEGIGPFCKRQKLV